jgi:hypothetical protein
MLKKNTLAISLWIIVVTLGLMLPAFQCKAASYRPDTSIRILSQYPDGSNSAPAQTQVWKIVPETLADGAMLLQFFLASAGSETAVCELEFSGAGRDGEVRWRGIGKETEKTCQNNFLLVPGFPAPCDVLPVNNPGDGYVYQDRNEAGGSVFIRKYQVTLQSVTPSEARANGWLDENTPDFSGLVMVTAVDQRGETAVRQLWPINGSWWIYEETPQRRSRRIY